MSIAVPVPVAIAIALPVADGVAIPVVVAVAVAVAVTIGVRVCVCVCVCVGFGHLAALGCWGAVLVGGFGAPTPTRGSQKVASPQLAETKSYANLRICQCCVLRVDGADSPGHQGTSEERTLHIEGQEASGPDRYDIGRQHPL